MLTMTPEESLEWIGTSLAEVREWISRRGMWQLTEFTPYGISGNDVFLDSANSEVIRYGSIDWSRYMDCADLWNAMRPIVMDMVSGRAAAEIVYAVAVMLCVTYAHKQRGRFRELGREERFTPGGVSIPDGATHMGVKMIPRYQWGVKFTGIPERSISLYPVYLSVRVRPTGTDAYWVLLGTPREWSQWYAVPDGADVLELRDPSGVIESWSVAFYRWQ